MRSAARPSNPGTSRAWWCRQFDQNVKGGIKRGERVTVVERSGNAVIAARANGKKLELPLEKAEDFEVCTARAAPSTRSRRATWCA